MTGRSGSSPPPESSRDIDLWLALRRVRRGSVRLLPPDLFTDAGRRLPEYLSLAMGELLNKAQIRVGEDHDRGQPAVEITPSGEQLFVKLDKVHRLNVSSKDQIANGDAAHADGEWR